MSWRSPRRSLRSEQLVEDVAEPRLENIDLLDRYRDTFGPVVHYAPICEVVLQGAASAARWRNDVVVEIRRTGIEAQSCSPVRFPCTCHRVQMA